MKKILFTSIMLVQLLISSAYAQSNVPVNQCIMPFSQFKPVLGGWSEYQVKTSDGPATTVRLSVVGKEGQDYWYETVIRGKDQTITKVLSSGDPNDMRNVKRMIIKYGDEPAVEVPISRSYFSKSSIPVKNPVSKGSEDIKVPAGNFIAEHFHYKEDGGAVDTWINDCVSPYAIVKSKSKALEMSLTGYGTGAESLIRENPQEIK